MDDYKNLRNAAILENERRRLSYIEALYFDGEKSYIMENLFFHYLTSLMNKKFKAGELSLEEARIKATKSINKTTLVTLKKQESKIRAVENAIFPAKITISVEWKRSAMWGANPIATVQAVGGFFEQGISSASGCGYDKESQAVAHAMNQCPSILKILYSAMEKNPTAKNEILGYGLGYSILPDFAGGVGISCYQSIFEKCGYIWQSSGHGKMFSCYTIVKN